MAASPEERTHIKENVALSSTETLLKIKDRMEALPNRGFIEVEKIHQMYGKNTLEGAKRTFALWHLEYERKRFVDLVKDAIEGGGLKVYEKHDDFLLSRFRSGDIFIWFGDTGVVDELRKKHLIINPLINQIIDKFRGRKHNPTKESEPIQPQKKTKLASEDSKVISLSDQPESEEQGIPPHLHFFTAPMGMTWNDVVITLVAKDIVEVKINGRTEKRSYHELGMVDRRKGDKPRVMWWFLVLLLKNRGFISKDSDSYIGNLVDTAKGFKKHMRQLFNIQDDVLNHYKSAGGYQAKFQAKDRTLIDFKELMNLPDP